MSKRVFKFSEGNANMRELLGGKGANLAEMVGLGLPIPQGFTITTEACTDYYNDNKTVKSNITIERNGISKFSEFIILITFIHSQRR